MKRPFLPSRSLPLLLWLVALAACLAIIGRTQFTADMSAFLPRSPTPQQQLLVDQLKQGVLSRTLLLGIEGGGGGGDGSIARARLSQALARRMEAGHDFVSVRNGDAAVLEKDRQILFGHRYLLSPAVTAEHFSVPGLHEAIGNSIDLLASPAGLLLKQLLPQDPSGEMVALLGDLGRSQDSSGPVQQGGVWASRDGKRAILMAQTRAEGSDTDAQEQTLARLRADFAAAASSLGMTDARLLVSGSPVFSVDARETIRSDVTRFSLISTVGIVALLLLIYRSATALALGLLPVASGALAGIAAVSLGFGTVHGITIGFGTTLIGEAVDYTIYYFVQSQQAGVSGGAVNEADWRNRFWPTIRLGVLTSVCGFASLLFSGFPGLAQLGLYSISGLIAAAAVTRFVLPQLLPRGFRIRDISGLGRTLGAITGRLGRLRWLAAGLSLGALAVLGVHHDGLWATGLSSLSPIPPAAQQLDQSLRAELGAPDMRYLMAVEAPDREAALAAAERIGSELQPLVDNGTIAGFDSPARYLPSIAAQRTRQQALPERHELAQRLPAALEGLPLQAARLAPFLDAVEAARQQPLLTATDLEGSTLALAVDALLLQRQHDWVALLPIKSVAGTDLHADAIQPALARAGQPHALFVDLQGESTQLYVTYLHEAILLSLAGFVAIVLLLAVTLRSPAKLLRVLAPLVAAVLLVIAGLALAGEAMTLLHLVGMLLIVAVGSNYALFFVGHGGAAEPQAIEPATLASLLIANVATVIGFGALAFSSVPVLHAMGITVGPGAILALLLAAILSPQSGGGAQA